VLLKKRREKRESSSRTTKKVRLKKYCQIEQLGNVRDQKTNAHEKDQGKGFLKDIKRKGGRRPGCRTSGPGFPPLEETIHQVGKNKKEDSCPQYCGKKKWGYGKDKKA